MSTKDPFSLTYTALWTLAESRQDLTKLVKLGNRIRYDTNDRNPEKRTGTDADYPELVLVSDGMRGNIWNTSSTSSTVRLFSWYVTTGDLRVTYRLLPVEFALFRAMCGWQTVLGALEWGGERFVKRTQLLTVTNGVLRPNARSDGPRGWAAIWSLEVEMHFAMTNLQA